MLVSKITPQQFNYSQNKQQSKQQAYIDFKNQDVSFGSKEPSKFFAPLKKFTAPVVNAYDKCTDAMANAFAGFLHLSPVKSIVEKSAGSKHLDKYLYAHLTAFTSFVLSGFYIQKTLDNKNLEEQKKNTLAINQGVVTVLSTASAYTLDNVLNERYGKFLDKFKDLNVGDAKLGKYMSGLKMLKTAVIFGSIYRFISPVFATPIANAIGNRIQEKKAADAKALVAQKPMTSDVVLQKPEAKIA